jgi:hypothetical protein
MSIKSVEEATENIKRRGKDMVAWHEIQRADPQNNTGVSCIIDQEISFNNSFQTFKKSKFSPIKLGTNRNMLLSTIVNRKIRKESLNWIKQS